MQTLNFVSLCKAKTNIATILPNTESWVIILKQLHRKTSFTFMYQFNIGSHSFTNNQVCVFFLNLTFQGLNPPCLTMSYQNVYNRTVILILKLSKIKPLWLSEARSKMTILADPTALQEVSHLGGIGCMK